MNKNIVKKIAVIGLGYVGLPLAVEFGKKRSVMGFDINQDNKKDIVAQVFSQAWNEQSPNNKGIPEIYLNSGNSEYYNLDTSSATTSHHLDACFYNKLDISLARLA